MHELSPRIVHRAAFVGGLVGLAVACGGGLPEPSPAVDASTPGAVPASPPRAEPARAVKWPATAGSLCAADEDEILSCALEGSGKQLSVCASVDLQDDVGTLQYRFGRPGAVELAYPPPGTPAAGHFALAFDPTDAVVQAWMLDFANDGTAYRVLHQSHRHEGDSVAVVVHPGTAKEIELWCGGTIAGALSRLKDALPVEVPE